MTDDDIPDAPKETPLEQNPAIYLREQPSPLSPCHRLVERLDSHDGAPVPMHMLAKVAVRVHQQALWQARRSWWERFAKRAGAALAGLALANISLIIGSWLKAHDARIEAEAEARAAQAAEVEYRRGVKEQLERMEQDIRDLRRDLRRFTGNDPGRVGIVATGAP